MRWIVQLIFTIGGISFGYTSGKSFWMHFDLLNTYTKNVYINAAFFGIIFYIIGIICLPLIEKLRDRLQQALSKQDTETIILGTVGILVGSLLGYLISLPIQNLNVPFLSSIAPLVICISLAYLGLYLAVERRDDWRRLFVRNKEDTSSDSNDNFHKYKILDTSVIIDGRIADIVKTNFIEGILLVPNFVLLELQHIADSSNGLSRTKGRRGLDMLNEMQNDENVRIEFYEEDFEDIDEVDAKIVHLAKILDASVITNDFNLNKVCQFQNITVLNINDLANAVKPILVAGETLRVQILKEGTERRQGIGYLDDGTMIVVEEAANYLGKWLNVTVTSVLQTSAGRMVFAEF